MLNFHLKKSDNNTPRLWLGGELIKYKKHFKFLGVTFDEKLSFDLHIETIVAKCRKRLNLLKALRGKSWGANPDTIMYTYKVYIRPILEYSCVLFAHANHDLLKKIRSIETKAIK